MVALRAALNFAHAQGYVTTNIAWREKLKPIKKADRRRTLYLDRRQRRALLDKLPVDARGFVEGLCLLPLRPGALAALTVADFDARSGLLTIAKDKAGEDRKILLPGTTADRLREHARNKLPRAALFSRWDGRAWDRDAWKGPIKVAAAAAKLPPGVVAFTLRHSTITDLVSAGLDLFSVAALSGTSVPMIQAHYGHVQQHSVRDALEGLAL